MYNIDFQDTVSIHTIHYRILSTLDIVSRAMIPYASNQYMPIGGLGHCLFGVSLAQGLLIIMLHIIMSSFLGAFGDQGGKGFPLRQVALAVRTTTCSCSAVGVRSATCLSRKPLPPWSSYAPRNESAHCKRWCAWTGA